MQHRGTFLAGLAPASTYPVEFDVTHQSFSYVVAMGRRMDSVNDCVAVSKLSEGRIPQCVHWRGGVVHLKKRVNGHLATVLVIAAITAGIL